MVSESKRCFAALTTIGNLRSLGSVSGFIIGWQTQFKIALAAHSHEYLILVCRIPVPNANPEVVRTVALIVRGIGIRSDALRPAGERLAQD
jgi:hypothetical protein